MNSYRGNRGNVPNVGGRTDQNALTGLRINNGMFVLGMIGQASSIRPAHVTDGLTKTARLSESLIGQDAHQFSTPINPMPRGSVVRPLCDAASKVPIGTNFGAARVRGSIDRTRYQHVMPPNSRTCLNEGVATRNGSATTARSGHPGGVTLAPADGSKRFVADAVDLGVWIATGSRNRELRSLALPRQ